MKITMTTTKTPRDNWLITQHRDSDFEKRLNDLGFFLDYQSLQFIQGKTMLSAKEGNELAAAALGCDAETVVKWLDSEHVTRGLY